MDAIKRLFALVALVPVIALFGGVGILSIQIGETWTEASTQFLLGTLATSCMGGAIVLAGLLALIVGVPLALRAYSAAAVSHKRWDDATGVSMMGGRQPRMLPGPGQYPAGPATVDGSWESSPTTYDMWGEDDDEWDNREFVQ
jgi:hypothetical protein